MGQVLHGSATTTEAFRRAIRARQESVRAAAKHYGISATTMQKWHSRQTSTDARMGPKEPRSSVLSVEDEAIIVAFRQHTLLPLDDSLYALQPSLPHLPRSSLHRCLQRHGVSGLPDVDGDKPKRSRFKAYPIGYFHFGIAPVSTEQGKLHLFVAIDRTSKFAFVQLHEKATQRIAAALLHDLIAAVPDTIHTVPTDNGIQFTDNHPVDEEAEPKAAAYWAERDEPRIYRWHSSEWAREQTKIEPRLTKPRCPWTNGQVERMNRTIKDATVKRYHYASHDELRQHLQLFVDAYNYGRRLKTLRGLTPYEFICQIWTKEPKRSSSIRHTTCRDRTSRMDKLPKINMVKAAVPSDFAKSAKHARLAVKFEKSCCPMLVFVAVTLGLTYQRGRLLNPSSRFRAEVIRMLRAIGKALIAPTLLVSPANAQTLNLSGFGLKNSSPCCQLAERDHLSPAIANALATTVQVEFFRLPADGSDWGPGIQRAQQFLVKAGGTLRISTPGALTIATQVTIPKGNPYLKLTCDSRASVLTNAASLQVSMFSIGGLTAAGGMNFDVDDCAFAGANMNASHAFSLNNANAMTIKNASFSNMSTAITSSNSYSLSLENVLFSGVTEPFYSRTSAHNLVAHRVKAYGGGTVFRLDGVSDNVSIDEGDFEQTASILQIAGGTALRYVGNYIEYFAGDPINPTSKLYSADISNNWIALGTGASSTWSLRNFVGGQFKGNSIYNQTIAFGSGTVDIEVGDNRQAGTGSVAATPYTAPPLVNSWTQQANYSLVGFRKGRDGKVYLRGNLLNRTSALGTTALILPPGYQPGTIRTFSTGNSANGVTAIQIGTDGTVKIMQTSGAGTSRNPYQASLDGIAFEPGT